MAETFRLAHVSDLHMTRVDGLTLGDLNVKRGLGLLNWARSRSHIHDRAIADRISADIVAQKPDHVAVTGDLANLGLLGEYGEALGWLERLGSGAQVSVVPGNHDIYTGNDSEAACLAAWRDYLSSDAPPDAGQFPYLRRRGALALIGLNSAVPTRPFVAAGRLGALQIERLDALLDTIRELGLFRVVMIHHPPLPGLAPPRRALADADALTAVLARHDVDLVLHGHNHTDMTTWLEGARKPIPVIGVPSGSARTSHGREPAARYYLFAIRATPGATEIERIVRGLDVPDGAIRELSRGPLMPD